EDEPEQEIELAGEEQVAQRGDGRVERGRGRGRQREDRMAEPRHVHNEDAEQRAAAQHVERSDPVALGERRLDVGDGRVGRGAHAPTVAQSTWDGSSRCLVRRLQRSSSMFETAIAGSLPKPSWLAETEKLWPEWKSSGAELERAKADATLLWLKVQEDAGIDVVGDGEQSRQHFVHGFLAKVEGIDFEHKVKMGIRDNRYDAMVPQVVGPLRLSGRVHAAEARLARAHTDRLLKFTLPGPMTIVDTVADRYYGEGKAGRIKMAFAFAELLNQEARALEADGVDIIQFDEPAFNVYMAEAAEWGVAALERAAEGLKCKTAVHICYGYGIKANVDWKATLGDEWRQYEQVFPALAKSRIDQVSLECIHSHVPAELM